MPQRMQWELAAISGRRMQTFRHDGKTAPHAGETCVLRKGAELDCAFARAWNLVDRMRDLRVADVGLVGSIVENDRLMLPRIVDPARQLGPRGYRASRVIGKAKINDVDRIARRLRDEGVFGSAR